MLAEIEAALQHCWEREALAVYADLLLARSDPRGTLISLALAGTPDAPRSRAQRRAAAEAWLGRFAGSEPWLDGDTGFIRLTLREPATARTFLDSHVAGYLRRLRIDAPTPEAHAAILEVLAERAHPWCAVVALQLPFLATASIDEAVVARFFEAAPRVRELELRGVVPRQLPPSVRTLVLDRPEGLVAPASCERVVVRSGGEAAAFARFLAPARFPELAELDLADRHADAYALFAQLEAAPRLTSLRLPSLRDAGEAQQLAAIRARFPDLAIELAVLHRPRAHLLDPALRVAAPVRVPCAPRDSYPLDARFLAALPDTPLAWALCDAELAANTDEHHAHFTSEQMAALELLFDMLARLGAVPVGFPGAAFARVAETMLLTDCDAMIGVTPWQDIHEALATQACSVQLRRPG